MNPWLNEMLRGRADPPLNVIVEVETACRDSDLAELRRRGLVPRGTALGRFIRVRVPNAAVLDELERIHGVVEIHYDMPKRIMPVLDTVLARFDPLLGVVRVSGVEVPNLKPPSPLAPFGGVGLPRVHKRGIEILSSSETKRIIVDVETSLSGRGVRVAVIDTGATHGTRSLLRRACAHTPPCPSPHSTAKATACGAAPWCWARRSGRGLAAWRGLRPRLTWFT